MILGWDGEGREGEGKNLQVGGMGWVGMGRERVRVQIGKRIFRRDGAERVGMGRVGEGDSHDGRMADRWLKKNKDACLRVRFFCAGEGKVKTRNAPP